MDLTLAVSKVLPKVIRKSPSTKINNKYLDILLQWGIIALFATKLGFNSNNKTQLIGFLN